MAKGIFLSSVSAQTSLTAERCENLWQDVEQELAAQLQQAECATKQQLEDMRTESNKDGQVGRQLAMAAESFRNTSDFPVSNRVSLWVGVDGRDGAGAGLFETSS